MILSWYLFEKQLRNQTKTSPNDFSYKKIALDPMKKVWRKIFWEKLFFGMPLPPPTPENKNVLNIFYESVAYIPFFRYFYEHFLIECVEYYPFNFLDD